MVHLYASVMERYWNNGEWHEWVDRYSSWRDSRPELSAFRDQKSAALVQLGSMETRYCQVFDDVFVTRGPVFVQPHWVCLSPAADGWAEHGWWAQASDCRLRKPISGLDMTVDYSALWDSTTGRLEMVELVKGTIGHLAGTAGGQALWIPQASGTRGKPLRAPVGFRDALGKRSAADDDSRAGLGWSRSPKCGV